MFDPARSTRERRKDQREARQVAIAGTVTDVTTGGAMGDPELWRDHPVAVDGWACAGCGKLRYPRRMAPGAITGFSVEGVEHGRAGRFADAELCFARIVWDWPGYLPGHLNYAEALRSRLAHLRVEPP